MRKFLVLICSLALACAAGAAQDENKSKKPVAKKQPAKTVPHRAMAVGHPRVSGPQKTKSAQRVATPVARPVSVAPQKTKGSQQLAARHPKSVASKAQPRSVIQKPAGRRSAVAGAQKAKGKTKGSQQIATQGGQTAISGPSSQKAKKLKGSTATAAATGPLSTKPFRAQHFNLPTKPKAEIAAVQFQQNRRIQGSDQWQGSNYQAFRTYRSEWHERDWWRHNHTRIILVGGGYYFWNSGYWYPAWGYDSDYSYYPYDGPIYGYNDLPPDQVVANVQSALQEQGYYHGEVDGLLGPLTRDAVADYQRDRGLYRTSAIDQPTLASLGMG
ncbi:MAG: peptidoglycan-binding protein [Verrucomicrobiota bacterium]